MKVSIVNGVLKISNSIDNFFDEKLILDDVPLLQRLDKLKSKHPTATILAIDEITSRPLTEEEISYNKKLTKTFLKNCQEEKSPSLGTTLLALRAELE